MICCKRYEWPASAASVQYAGQNGKAHGFKGAEPSPQLPPAHLALVSGLHRPLPVRGEGDGDREAPAVTSLIAARKAGQNDAALGLVVCKR